MQTNTIIMDAESLKKNGSPRLRCLDVFLVVSVVFLFAAVAAVTAAGLTLGMKLKSEMLPPSRIYDDKPSIVQQYTSDVYKMQNFAHLRGTKEKLETGTMTWAAVASGAGTSVGSLFVFNKDQDSIGPTRSGHYFIYVDLKLKCSHRCNAGHFKVSVGDRLTCTVELPEWNDSTPTPIERKCWQVASMDKATRLVTQITVPSGLEEWTFVATQGLFLVD